MKITLELTEKEIDLLFDTVEITMYKRVKHAVSKKKKQQADDDFYTLWNINQKIAEAIDQNKKISKHS